MGEFVLLFLYFDYWWGVWFNDGEDGGVGGFGWVVSFSNGLCL